MNRLSSKSREKAAGYLFIAPAVLGFLLFVFAPTIIVIILSLFKWDMIGEMTFLGLGNYSKLFTSSRFLNTIKVSALYVVYNIPPQFVISLLFAVALKNVNRGNKLLRTLILVPWITTPLAISVVWKWVLNEKIGMVNYYIKMLGFNAIKFFSNDNALLSMAWINIWQYVGFSTIIFYVGLQSIPDDYYEAADVDGVGSLAKFWYITLPLLKPTIMFQAVTGIINSFQVFDTVYGITKGGPGQATNVFYYAIYQEAFQFLNMGYASAMCVVLFVILLIFTIIQLYMFREN